MHHKVVVDVRAVIHLMLRVGDKADEPAAVAGSSGFLVHQEQCNRLRHRRDEDISVLLIVLVRRGALRARSLRQTLQDGPLFPLHFLVCHGDFLRFSGDFQMM